MARLMMAVVLSLLAVGAAGADTPPTYYGRWGGTGTDPGQFQAASGVAVDPYGLVYVADYNNQRIQKFEALGSFLNTWGSFGSDTSQFIGPWAVATSKAGNVYVVEIGQHRIQEFTRDGLFIRKWGMNGTAVGQFQTPSGIAIGSNGALYVSERVGNRIQEFDLNGNFIRAWGSQGAGDGQFTQPLDVAVGADGSVYVTDQFNDRVQKFDSTGTFVAKWDWALIGTPGRMAVDVQGNLLVCDVLNRQVVKLDPQNGNVLTTFGSSGNGPGQFMAPEALAVSPSGYIYVTDSQLNFVSLFVPTSVSAPPSAAEPAGFNVLGSIPNPMRTAGAIRFDLPSPGPVTIGIYDVSGRLVRQISKEAVYGKGSHEVAWDGRNDSHQRLPAGIYHALVRSGSFSGSHKLVIVE